MCAGGWNTMAPTKMYTKEESKSTLIHYENVICLRSFMTYDVIKIESQRLADTFMVIKFVASFSTVPLLYH